MLGLALIFGLFYWPATTRQVRGVVLSIRNRDYVDAARVLGASDVRILARHVLPNVISIVTVVAGFDVASAILGESALSFLGLRRAGAALELGQHAQRLAGHVQERALAGLPAGPDDLADGALRVPDRRRPARRVRPAPAHVSEQWRLFVGIALGDEWTERLSEVADRLQGALGRRVRWVRPELYHVTIVFLGNQSPEAVDNIGEALQRATATVEAFPLHLTELRRLGGHEQGAIVAGVEDTTGRLQAVRKALDGELRAQAIHFDAKPLVPHITLGRPRKGAGRIDLPHVDLRDAPPLDVSEVALFKSDLRADGPRYEVVATAALGKDGALIDAKD